jgi:hypothetical protein
VKSSDRYPNEQGSALLAEEALKGLLGEFRAGRVAQGHFERDGLREYLAELSRQWDEMFPGLPAESFAYSSFRGVSRRGVRDAYLKEIIVKLLGGIEGEDQTIINPVCVWGRHARELARRLPEYRVIATDIRSEMDRLLGHVPFVKTPANYEFQQDDIFQPTLQTRPAALVFFGACGSLSDAAMDYALKADAGYVVCRTCCHDNIGGNTAIVKRFNMLNLLFRLKNIVYAYKRRQKTGEYFSPKYAESKYPRSETARGLSNSAEFVEVARRTVDSDICRSIIDLDRYFHLAEAGYNVWYRAEMFVARKRGE